MMLEATNVGVDNIWIELFDVDKMREAIKKYHFIQIFFCILC